MREERDLNAEIEGVTSFGHKVLNLRPPVGTKLFSYSFLFTRSACQLHCVYGNVHV